MEKAKTYSNHFLFGSRCRIVYIHQQRKKTIVLRTFEPSFSNAIEAKGSKHIFFITKHKSSAVEPKGSKCRNGNIKKVQNTVTENQRHSEIHHNHLIAINRATMSTDNRSKQTVSGNGSHNVY